MLRKYAVEIYTGLFIMLMTFSMTEIVRSISDQRAPATWVALSIASGVIFGCLALAAADVRREEEDALYNEGRS